MRFKYLITGIFICLPFLVWGAQGGDIPARFVFFQILNWSVFVVILVYLVRKKLSPVLKRDRADFLAYKSNALKLEEEQKDKMLSLEKDIQDLKEKQKNLKVLVSRSVDLLKKEEEQNSKAFLDQEKSKMDRKLKRQTVKEFYNLKTHIVSSLIIKIQENLNQKIQEQENFKTLNQSSIKKWDKL